MNKPLNEVNHPKSEVELSFVHYNIDRDCYITQKIKIELDDRVASPNLIKINSKFGDLDDKLYFECDDDKESYEEYYGETPEYTLDEIDDMETLESLKETIVALKCTLNALNNSINAEDFKDFIVWGSASHCVHNNHTIMPIKANVLILKKGRTEPEYYEINANYCEQCRVYFITKSQYNQLKKIGTIICKVVQYEKYIEPSKTNYEGWKEESILKENGYSVNKNDDLNDLERQTILKNLIERKVCTSLEIENHLNWLISSRQSYDAEKYEDAIEKWENDIEFVNTYEVKGAPLVGVRSITQNIYKRK